MYQGNKVDNDLVLNLKIVKCQRLYSYVTMTTANGKVCTDVDNNTHIQHIQWQTCTSKIHHFNLYKWPWLEVRINQSSTYDLDP